eukprot:13243583-Alexandrium_andersonii.AAC.1
MSRTVRARPPLPRVRQRTESQRARAFSAHQRPLVRKRAMSLLATDRAMCSGFHRGLRVGREGGHVDGAG